MGVQFVLGFITAIAMLIMVVPFIYKKWKKQKLELLNNYARLVDLTETTKDSIYYYQLLPEEKFLYMSPSLDNLLGQGTIAEAYANPENCFKRIHPDDYEILRKKVTGELDYSKSIIQRWKDKSGGYRWFEEYATPIYENGELVAVKGVLRNIDEKIELQQELEYRIKHDALTDLYNKDYFEQKNAEFNEQLDIPVAIIICDLDELKYVNDNLGHKEGDRLIKEMADVLKKFSSDTMTIARIGGDEFAIIIAYATEKETEDLVQRILSHLKKYNENNLRKKIEVSIGFAFSNHSKGNMGQVFSQADKQMYENKFKRKQFLSR